MGCQFCEKPIPDNLAVCPHCGHLQDAPGENNRRLARFALVCALAVIILAAWHWLTG